MQKEKLLNALVAIVRKGLREITAAAGKRGSRRIVSRGSHTETILSDLKVGRALERYARSLLGDVPLLVEETAPREVDLKRYQLVIDPIDCTRGFLHNLPGTGCAVAFLENGRPVLSAIGQIAATSTGEKFLTDIVCGGFIRGRWRAWAVTERGRVACHASPRTAPGDFIVSVEMDAFDTARANFQDGFRLAQGLMPPRGRARAIRMFGSSSLNFVALGRGSLDICTGSRKPWDSLPGIPVVLGAGGSIFFYKDSRGNTRLCAAGNEKALRYARERHAAAGMALLGDTLELAMVVTPSV